MLCPTLGNPAWNFDTFNTLVARERGQAQSLIGPPLTADHFYLIQ
jgi:hypothetical protein